MVTNAPSTPDPQPMVAGPSQTPRKRRILATPESSDNEHDKYVATIDNFLKWIELVTF